MTSYTSILSATSKSSDVPPPSLQRLCTLTNVRDDAVNVVEARLQLRSNIAKFTIGTGIITALCAATATDELSTRCCNVCAQHC